MHSPFRRLTGGGSASSVDSHIKGNHHRRTVNCQWVLKWDAPDGVKSITVLSFVLLVKVISLHEK